MILSKPQYNTLWLSLLAIALSTSCSSNKQEPKEKAPKHDAIIGLASPIRLQPGKNVLYLADYFHQPELLDSFSTEKRIEVTRVGDSLLIEAPLAQGNPLAQFSFWAKEESYQIPVFLSAKRAFQVAFSAKEGAYQKVQIKGEMNAWNPSANELVFENGEWSCELLLEPGTYQYKLVADGEEIEDPSNPDKVSNGLGGFNSLITVKQESNSTKPNVLASTYTETSILFDTKYKPSQIHAYWQNLSLEVVEKDNGTFSINLPSWSDTLVRSYIRVYTANEAGLGNDVLVPLQKGKVLNDVADLRRTDYHGLVLYNAFVDRFNNADTTNDSPTPNDSIHPRANYHGGDVLGVVEKVQDGYFESLGVNGIWLSPIVKNTKGAFGYWPNPETKFSAYHGYWPTSFTAIDRRMGTPTNLEELVDMAHNKNLNVFLDFVANHVHQEHPVYQAHKDWATNLYLKDGTLNTERWDNHRLSTWFDTFMPSLKLYDPEVYEMLTDSALWWVKRYHIDGFRHDATKHVPHQFWRALTQKMKTQVLVPEGKEVYQIGETYGSRGLVSSYVNTGELNAQFDFNVYDDAVAVFAGGEGIERLKTGLEKSLDAFGSHHLMGNITGNQDRARFVSYADGTVRFDEDAKAAGWTREIKIQDSSALDKMALLMAFNFFVPGVPVIYYGDEIGMCGGNDPDNRRMMRFENLGKKEQELKATVGELGALRHNNLVLQFGTTKVLKAEGDVMVIERRYFNQVAYLYINNADQAANVSLENKSLKNGETKKPIENGVLELPPYSFEIFITETL